MNKNQDSNKEDKKMVKWKDRIYLAQLSFVAELIIAVTVPSQRNTQNKVSYQRTRLLTFKHHVKEIGWTQTNSEY